MRSPFCVKCGSTLDPDLDMCANCGAEVIPDHSDDDLLFRFSRGSFFGGRRDYEIRLLENGQCRLTVEGSNGDWTTCKAIVSYDDVVNAVGFMKTLKWDKKYAPDYAITDGFSWGVDLNLDGCVLHSSGYESYPRDFEQTRKTIEDRLMSLCEQDVKAFERKGKRLVGDIAFCARCGELVPVNAKYCNACGELFELDGSELQPAVLSKKRVIGPVKFIVVAIAALVIIAVLAAIMTKM